MGVITKLLQDKDSFHCIALFNVTQLYENLKTNKKQTKKQQDTLLPTQSHTCEKTKQKVFFEEMTIWTVSNCKIGRNGERT